MSAVQSLIASRPNYAIDAGWNLNGDHNPAHSKQNDRFTSRRLLSSLPRTKKTTIERLRVKNQGNVFERVDDALGNTINRSIARFLLGP